MRFGDYDNLRRQFLIMIRGQELTPIQANELKELITERTINHVDEPRPFPPELIRKIVLDGYDLNEG